MLWPRQAGKFISERAKDVKLVKEGVTACAEAVVKDIQDGNILGDASHEVEHLPPRSSLSSKQLVNWIFLTDSLNFNFWTPDNEPKYTVEYNGLIRTGYMGLAMAIKRAFDERKPIYDPRYYSALSLDEVAKIFRSSTSSVMPLMPKRKEVLAQVGGTLIEKYDGEFSNVLKLADRKGQKLIELVCEEFPCFRDVHTYDGQEVAFFKRAQILVADLWTFAKGDSLTEFTDMDQLTMFADYRVPQSLVYFGVLEYSEELKKKLSEEYLFTCGQREEVEIRGVSIEAVERIVKECNQLLSGNKTEKANAMSVDYFLWRYRYQNAENLKTVPYHRTRCIFY